MSGRSTEGPQEPGARKPYDVFAADVYGTLVGEVTRFAAASVPGGLPVGFDVRDFVQHALLQLLDVYPTLANEGAAYVYARRTATNALLDAARAAGRRQAPEWLAGVAAVHRARQRTPDDAVEQVVLRRRVSAALDRLPERQRLVVRLLYMEGFSRQEAAKIIGASPETVKSLAQRARATLTVVLKGTAAVLAVQRTLRRFQRPVTATAVGVPRMALVLCVAAVQMPVVRPAPTVEALVAPLAPMRPLPVASGPRAAAPAPPGRPAAQVPRPAVTSPRAAVRPRATHPPHRGPATETPQGGGCLGDTCVGIDKTGDELCVDTEQEPSPVCANQTLVGVCPAAEQLALPRTRCTRYSAPVYDP